MDKYKAKETAQMYPLASLEYMEKMERSYSDSNSGGTRLVVILIAQPGLPDGRVILDQFNSIHYQSGEYCGIYVPGFSHFGFTDEYADAMEYPSINHVNWHYSDKAFWETIEQLQDRIKWRFSGESEMLLLQSKAEGKSALSFQNYIALQITHAIRKGYCESFPRLMTQIITASKLHVLPDRAMANVAYQNIDLKEIVLDALCELVPGKAAKTAAKAMKDKAFFMTAAMASRRRAMA